MNQHEHQDMQRHIQAGLPRMLLSRPGDSKVIITCLVGSTRYPGALAAAEELLTRMGKIVLGVGIRTWADYGVDTTDFFRQQPWEGLDGLHFKKIDLADEVLVVNPGGYIGRSCAREILYARWTGTPVFYLEGDENDPEPLPSSDELGIESTLLVYSTDACGRDTHYAIAYRRGKGVAFCCANEAALHGYFPRRSPIRAE